MQIRMLTECSSVKETCKVMEVWRNLQGQSCLHFCTDNFSSAPGITWNTAITQTAWHTTSSSHSILVKEGRCAGMETACGVSSPRALMEVVSRASWDTTALQAAPVELFSCTAGTLPWTSSKLLKWLFSPKDSNRSESLGDAYSSSGCSVLCPSSFLGEPSTMTRKDFHGVFLSCIEVCLRRVDLSVKVRPHALHMYGFSPVWMRWWRWRAFTWVNCFPHWSQQ